MILYRSQQRARPAICDGHGASGRRRRVVM